MENTCQEIVKEKRFLIGYISATKNNNLHVKKSKSGSFVFFYLANFCFF